MKTKIKEEEEEEKMPKLIMEKERRKLSEISSDSNVHSDEKPSVKQAPLGIKFLSNDSSEKKRAKSQIHMEKDESISPFYETKLEKISSSSFRPREKIENRDVISTGGDVGIVSIGSVNVDTFSTNDSNKSKPIQAFLIPSLEEQKTPTLKQIKLRERKNKLLYIPTTVIHYISFIYLFSFFLHFIHFLFYAFFGSFYIFLFRLRRKELKILLV